MNFKTKKIFTNVKVIIVLVAVLLALVAIHPVPNAKGVAIRNVLLNSSASIAGIESPKPTSSPTSKERMLSMNNEIIEDITDYYEFTNKLEPNRTVQIKTNKKIYRLTTKPLLNITYLDEKEPKIIEEIIQVNKTINGTLTLVNETINKTILVNKKIETVIGTEELGLSVYNAPKTNIRKGLDLQGGTRVLLEPEEELDQDGMDILIENMMIQCKIYRI